jgi:hypothetical protein
MVRRAFRVNDYKLFDVAGLAVDQGNLQDKGFWCADGAAKEHSFVDKYGAELGLRLHPNKLHDPYGPDLIHSSGEWADLKTQNTPFFQARKMFELDPQYTVTFNVKDRARYEDNYPNILIFFAVEWLVLRMQYTSGYERKVIPMWGVWEAPFQELLPFLKEDKVHRYQQRIGDKYGNAQLSYVLSLKNFRRLI